MLIGGDPPRPGVLLAAAVVAAASVTVCTSCRPAPAGNQPSTATSVITSTTTIAGAGVLGNARRPDESCAPQPAAPDPGPPTRPAPNAEGINPPTEDVPADPQRIVVLSGDQLDALCALGLQSRIVDAALPVGSESQPSYLGTVIHKLPGIGSRNAPNLPAIAAAKPDLILGAVGAGAQSPQVYSALAAITPTVFTGAPGTGWEDNLRGVGAATGRAAAADAIVDDFKARAEQTGAAHDAAHYQASIVQLTDKTVRVYGANNFPASVLRAVGVDRPGAQRFTDKPFVEFAASDSELAGAADFSAAEGDVVYVSFESPAAKDHAPAVMDSNAWRRLSATRDNRVFIVNNEVWQTGQGVVAARGILDDLHLINAPIN